MRILVIEDNIELGEELASELKKYGLICDIATDGINGEEMAYSEEYDAIILDLNLPGKDGIEILRFLRNENVNTPIIITTARDKLNERTEGLDSGADDYVVKPFEVDEVRARIQAVIRRYHGRNRSEITIGRLTLFPSERKIVIDSQRVNLLAKEIDILEYIMNRYPAFVSQEEIMDHIYGDSYNEHSSVIRVHIAKLRNKLKEVAGEDVLMNQRGKGYYLWEELRKVI